MGARTRRSRRRPSRGSPRSPRASDHIRTNLALWERTHDGYDRRHRRSLGGRKARAWGFWRVPEDELGLLGEVEGRDVLELGCGAGRWSIALAREGARAVGLDLSAGQLGRAASLARRTPTRPAFVRGNAEHVPFRDGAFDVVFCDWGAMTFADPYRTVPECARLLRRGGVLAFSTSSPFRDLCHDPTTDRIGRRLSRDYFGLHRLAYPHEINFQLGYGEWIRLFRENGLSVDSLSETRPPSRRKSTYLSARESAWGRRWPLECIWKARRDR